MTPTQRIGPFEIVSLLGRGGMGEVFLATDTRLDRKVAIKILPSELSSNASLKQRFEREAKAISNLSHPHICTLHDVGHEDGIDYLVMEYLEGQTLADRLSKGPLPIEEVLRYALQICEALDKAHRQGIVHRDLKPGNIMLTKHGVKLLDFGLAKICAPLQAQFANQQSQIDEDAPTLQATRKEPLTEEGTILGTIQYMAPEQLEGKEADARTDIFAFGAVLYEMASGKKAFSGKSRASLMAAILEREPERLSQIAPLIPPALDRLVAGCLAKDPEERWQTAHDLKLQLKWILEGGSETGVPKPVAVRHRRRELFAWCLVVIATGIAAHFALSAKKSAPAQPKVSRYKLSSPSVNRFDSIALSPSGRKLAIAAFNADSKIRQLWIQSMDALTPQLVANTDQAEFPFWSPDESAVAFWSDGTLKKVELQNRIVSSLCSLTRGFGGTWGSKGTILFSRRGENALYQVASTGGIPHPVTDPSASELRHIHPFFLPDGEHFLFWKANAVEVSVAGVDQGSGGIYVASLQSPAQPRLLLSSTGNAVYAAGHLVYYDNGILMAAPFDAKALKVESASFLIAERVDSVGYYSRLGFFSTAEDGSLIYLPDARATNRVQLTWYHSDGSRPEAPVKSGNFVSLQLSPDGRLACVEHFDPDLKHEDIWIWDTELNSSVRITTHPSHDRHGIWSPDGKRVVFCSYRARKFDLYIKEVDSVEPEKILLQTSQNKYPQSWSRDGKYLLFDSSDDNSKADLWYLHMTEDPPRAEILLPTDHAEERARFSPDGKWIVYESDEQKTREIFAFSFPDRHGKRKISNAGGTSPRWSHDGTKIYYMDLENYVVEVEVEVNANGLDARSWKRLFQIRPQGDAAPFDVAPDGRRFLVNEALESTNAVPLTVILNWPLEFQKKSN